MVQERLEDVRDVVEGLVRRRREARWPVGFERRKRKDDRVRGQITAAQERVGEEPGRRRDEYCERDDSGWCRQASDARAQ